MSFEISGRIVQKSPTQQVNDNFKKREFVLEINDEISGKTFTNYAKFQLVQNKCDAIDRFNEGDQVKVNFNIKGNRWEKDGRVNYITNLDAWRIEPVSNEQPANMPAAGYAPPAYQQPAATPAYNPGMVDPVDDLPF